MAKTLIVLYAAWRAARGALLVAAGIVGALILNDEKIASILSQLARHTSVIDVKGEIAADKAASADNIMSALREAFTDKRSAAVVLRIDSPGGSPVQSAMIYDEIRRLRTLHPSIPIYALIGDLCASGGYYIAAATDMIIVNESSIVGSIGVIMSSFGFVGAMDKLGIERRVMTAGSHKAILDPFAPTDPIAREHLQKMLGNVHDKFIQAVRHGRGARLKETPDMFSGLVWTGEEAIKIGLADATGDFRHLAEDIIKAPSVVDYTPTSSVVDRIVSKLGVSVATALTAALTPWHTNP